MCEGVGVGGGGFPPSVFEPRVGGDGGFTAVSVVVQQLLALVDVPGGHEDEVGDAVDVVEFGLAVSVLAVVYQPAHPARLFGGVHTMGGGGNWSFKTAPRSNKRQQRKQKPHQYFLQRY